MTKAPTSIRSKPPLKANEVRNAVVELLFAAVEGLIADIFGLLQAQVAWKVVEGEGVWKPPP